MKRDFLKELGIVAVLIDDSMPAVAVKASGDVPAHTAYTTYVLGDGAIDHENIGAKVPYEMYRNPAKNGGQDTLYSRQRKVFAPKGISYEKKSQATLSPTDDELANGANWAIVNDGAETGTKAALLETCFIDDADDMNIYLNNRANIADAVTNALISNLCGNASDVSTKTNTSQNTTESKASGTYIVGRQKEVPFKVRLLTDLNVRKSPNGFVVIQNGAHKGTIYTIVEVNGNWGRLKSGAGWISIYSKYVERA